MLALAFLRLGTTALLATLVLPGARASGWGGAVGVASDKVTHGISQSGGRPTAMLDLNYRSDTAWMANLGLATLPRGEGEQATEITLGLAHAWQLDPDWLTQFGYVHYQYTGYAPAGIRHYEELNASIGWRGRVAASLSLSPDTYSWYRAGGPRAGPTAAVELTVNQRIAGRLALQAGLGYNQLLDAGNWGHGYNSLGLNWGVGPVQFYLSHVRSDAAKRGLVPSPLAGDRWLGTVLWGF